MMSNLGKWAPWYSNAYEQIPYGDTLTYSIAEEWLRGLDVEDWGCGYGWFRNIHLGGYKGIDGTRSKWCDFVADLSEYTSDSPGILLRHVLEHNHSWANVLDNAVASFSKRLCIVLFTPMTDETTVIVNNVCGLGVPDISFNINDILNRLDCCADVSSVVSSSVYGLETIIKAHR